MVNGCMGKYVRVALLAITQLTFELHISDSWLLYLDTKSYRYLCQMDTKLSNANLQAVCVTSVFRLVQGSVCIHMPMCMTNLTFSVLIRARGVIPSTYLHNKHNPRHAWWKKFHWTTSLKMLSSGISSIMHVQDCICPNTKGWMKHSFTYQTTLQWNKLPQRPEIDAILTNFNNEVLTP